MIVRRNNIKKCYLRNYFYMPKNLNKNKNLTIENVF